MPQFHQQRDLDQVKQLVADLPRKQVGPGTLLISPELVSTPYKIGFLHSGSLKTYKHNDAAPPYHQTAFDFFQGPDWFGFEFLVSDRSLTHCESITDCEISFVTQDWIKDQAPLELMKDLMLCLIVHRSFHTNQIYAEHFKLKHRILQCLIHLGRRLHDRTLPLSQKELSDLIGSSRDATSRMLKTLEKENLVSIQHKKINLADDQTLIQALREATG